MSSWFADVAFLVGGALLICGAFVIGTGPGLIVSGTALVAIAITIESRKAKDE